VSCDGAALALPFRCAVGCPLGWLSQWSTPLACAKRCERLVRGPGTKQSAQRSLRLAQRQGELGFAKDVFRQLLVRKQPEHAR
jgi:hypothetical protein